MLSVPSHVIESTAMTFSLRLGTRVIKTGLVFKFLWCCPNGFGTPPSSRPSVAASEPSSTARRMVGSLLLIQDDNTRLYEILREQKQIKKRKSAMERRGIAVKDGGASNYRFTLSAEISNHRALASTVNFSAK